MQMLWQTKATKQDLQTGREARSIRSHIKSRLEMEPHVVSQEITKSCTNKDHHQPVRPVCVRACVEDVS